MAQERATKSMAKSKSDRRGGHLPELAGVVAALAGLVLCLAVKGADAQTAAQKTTLTRISHKLNSTRPLVAGGDEASNTVLDMPSALAFDAAGDLFIADTADNQIIEVDLNGILTTVAGTGQQGFGGDGGPATSALLDSPVGIAIDTANNLYFADTNNNRIREISNGVITTIAGTGATGFSGDGAAATAAVFSRPTALAVDSNANLYIADTDNNRIREISNGVIATVAGNGSQMYSGDGGLATAAGLDSPAGVAVDSSFNIYISDTHNQRIRMVTFTTGIITTIAGTGVKGFSADGPALSAELAHPTGVSVDNSGTVYFADTDNQRIRSIAGAQVATIAGDGQQGYSGNAGSPSNALLNSPLDVAVFGDSVALADTGNQVVQKVTGNTVNTVAGSQPQSLELLSITGPASVLYGTGTLKATFTFGSGAATGLVTFLDGIGANPATVGSASLASNTATLNTSLLAAGSHSIIASYAGDANDPPIVSGVFVLVVTPVQLTDVANPVSMLYGAPVPVLTGTLTGVLAQDSGKVTANYSTSATSTAAPGSYPIAVTLSGSAAGNYTLVLGATSGSLAIAQAPSSTTLAASTAAPISGTTLTLTATVATTTTGTPTGGVNFYDGAILLNPLPVALVNGAGTLSITTLPVGAHSLIGVYSGDANFLASTSSAVAESVLSQDFSIVASPPSQTILPAQIAAYTLTLTPVNSTFVYPVTLSVSGLPPGVSAAFSPAGIAAGASASTVTLTLNAGAHASGKAPRRPAIAAGPVALLALLAIPLVAGRRLRRAARRLSRIGQLLIILLTLAAAGALSACGGGGFFAHSTQSYTVTVTATCGSATHTSTVNLTLQ